MFPEPLTPLSNQRTVNLTSSKRATFQLSSSRPPWRLVEGCKTSLMILSKQPDGSQCEGRFCLSLRSSVPLANWVFQLSLSAIHLLIVWTLLRAGWNNIKIDKENTVSSFLQFLSYIFTFPPSLLKKLLFTCALMQFISALSSNCWRTEALEPAFRGAFLTCLVDLLSYTATFTLYWKLFF